MTTNEPNQVRAAALTWFWNFDCLLAIVPEISLLAQKYQARILSRRFHLRRDRALLLVGFALSEGGRA